MHPSGSAVPTTGVGDGAVSCNGASSAAGGKVIACIDAEVDMCTPKAFELRGV